MAYEDLVGNFASALGGSLGALTDTTTIGTAIDYEDITHIAYGEDCVAKIWIGIDTFHPKSTISGFSRNFIVDIEGVSASDMEAIVDIIERLPFDYIQTTVDNPMALEVTIIDCEYDESEVIFFHKFRITAKWDWIRV